MIAAPPPTAPVSAPAPAGVWLGPVLARMPANHTVRGFVFNAVLDEVGRRAGPAAAGEISRRLFRKPPGDLFSYGAHDFFRLIDAGAIALRPMGEAEALEALGFAAAIGFFASPMGRMLLGIVGKGDPSRLMANEPTAYATSFTFGKRRYERSAPKEIRLHHDEDFLPVAFNVGALHGALTSISATGKVRAEGRGQDAATYFLTW